MLPYLILFFIVIIFTNHAEKLLKKNKNNRAIVVIGLTIFIISFFAAIRNDEVGRDINTYVIPPFEWAKKLDFKTFLISGNLEKGYMTYIYLCTHIFKDYHFILFGFQLIVSLIMFIYAYKQRNEMSISLVVLTYLLLFFNDTLTMMRQSIAFSLILLSIIKLKEKKYINMMVVYILAILFHTTAVVAAVVYIILLLNSTDKINKKNKNILNVTLVVTFWIGFLFYDKLLYIFTFNIPILPSKFWAYMSSSYYNMDSITVSKSMLTFKLICIFIAFYMNKIQNRDEIKECLIFLCIDLGIFFVSFKLQPVMRIGYYFSYPALLYIIPHITDMFKKDKYNRICVNLLIFVVLISFWYFTNILKGEGGGTYPYKSDIITRLFY